MRRVRYSFIPIEIRGLRDLFSLNPLMCWCWVAIDCKRVKPSEKDRNAFSWLTFQSSFLPPSPSGTWVPVSMHAQKKTFIDLRLAHTLLHVCLCGQIKKWMCSLTNVCITFHCYKDCFESLSQESRLHHQLQQLFHICCSLKRPGLGVEDETRPEVR